MGKITFRADDELTEWLEGYVEDADYSKSDVMRSHLENLKEDDFYRKFHEEYMDGGGSLKEFVEDRDEFESKWVDVEQVDYDEMFSRFKSIKHAAEEGDTDKAYEMVAELGEEGYEREEILLHSVVAAFDE